MSNPCGCEDSNSIPPSTTNPNLPTVNAGNVFPPVTHDCHTMVHKNVCVEAQVIITPKVTSGPSKVFCHGKPKFKPCSGKHQDICSVTVSQKICIQIPLTFSAVAKAFPTDLVCGQEEFGPCSHHVTACTHKIRYFKKHPDVMDWLITSAGGSIVLGKVDPINGNIGASFRVTTANAMDVLSLNTPSPPVPGSSPLDEQYRMLYAQLLTANLNILNGATCPFATSAITIANQFLADSPSGIGMEGAPTYSAQLKKFNWGKGPGCPGHCKKNKKEMSQ